MTGTTTRPRPELVEKPGELARETGSTPDELEAGLREHAEYERRKAAMIQERPTCRSRERGRPGPASGAAEPRLEGRP